MDHKDFSTPEVNFLSRHQVKNCNPDISLILQTNYGLGTFKTSTVGCLLVIFGTVVWDFSKDVCSYMYMYCFCYR